MRTIFFDTSVDNGVLALFVEGEPATVLPVPSGPNGGDLPSLIKGLLIKGLLESKEMTVKDLDCLSVGIGPGSYTGMRKSASVAASLCYAAGLPLITFNSLEGYMCDGPFAVLLDAKRGKVFCLYGNKSGEKVTYEGQPQLVLPSEVDLERSLVSPHQTALEKLFAGARWEKGEQNLNWIAKACEERYQKKDFIKKWPLKLLYLQEPYTFS